MDSWMTLRFIEHDVKKLMSTSTREANSREGGEMK